MRVQEVLIVQLSSKIDFQEPNYIYDTYNFPPTSVLCLFYLVDKLIHTRTYVQQGFIYNMIIKE